MKKLHKKLHSHKIRRFSKPVLIVLSIAVIGTATLLVSNAATNNYLIEPESSTLSGNVAAIGDATASGAQAIQFTSGGSSSSCALPKYPTPTCTGMPAGTTFSNTVSNYIASSNDQIIDGWHITGDLRITADRVVVKNSQIDGIISNDIASEAYHSTIIDTTIGKTNVCDSGQAIDTPYDRGGYTAQRVKVIGHDDGFRAGGPNITIRDSYVKNCGFDGSHGDGIQDYPWAQNLIFDHNTMDLCGPWTVVPTSASDCNVPGHNSPIFLGGNYGFGAGSSNVSVTNNMVLGGVYSVYLYPVVSPWVVTGNRVVNGTWDFGAYETGGHCSIIGQWADNRIVTINPDYTIASTISTVTCPQ